MKKLAVCLTILYLLGSCNRKNKNEVFEQLVGTWKIDGKNEFERWSKNQDGTFNSVMFSVIGTDTNFSEVARIYKNSENWFFETTVKNQNNEKPVVFKAIQLDDAEVTFENPTHDFPKVINYSLVSSSKLAAFISSGSDTIRFNFSRLQ